MAGEDAGTVCRKKHVLILHCHSSQRRNAGQGFIQYMLLPVGVKNPLRIIRVPTRLDVIQLLPFHRSLYGDTVQRNRKLLNRAAAFRRVICRR